MGQYWYPVSLTKREYINPHKLGTGLKLWEQAADHPGTSTALVILCAAMPEARGGGDFDLDENWHGPERKFPEHNISPGPMPEGYSEIAHRTIGRWAGDRIALVGDYAEDGDLKPKDHASLILALCDDKEGMERLATSLREEAAKAEKASRKKKCLAEAEFLEKAEPFKDITDDVVAVIEHELGGEFVGEGWKQWKEIPSKE